jgi:ferredoxin
MVCLENDEEMPSEPAELELARGEGIRVLLRQALKRVLNRDGRIVAVELMAVVSVFDEQGRFRPQYDPSRVRTLAADTVILSIGQAPDRSWARGTPVPTDSRGRVAADRETHATPHAGIFLAGESLRGPGSAIEAVADGHRAADVVGHYLATGKVSAPKPDDARPLDPFPADVMDSLRRMHSVAREPEPFAEAEPSLSEGEARREGDRCLGCLAGAVIDEETCAACLTCFRVCPLDAVVIGDPLRPDPVRCQACGVCAAMCPAHAIRLSFWEPEHLGDPVPATAARSGEAAPSISLVCRYRSDDGGATDGHALTVPCLARLRPVDLLRLVRRGYRTVRLYPCDEQGCKYGAAWGNIQFLVGYADGILRSAGVEANVELCLPERTAAASGEGEAE